MIDFYDNLTKVLDIYFITILPILNHLCNPSDSWDYYRKACRHSLQRG